MFFTFESGGDRIGKFFDQFINVITKTDTRTGRQRNGQRVTQIAEVIDITPVCGSCLLCRAFAKAAFDDGLFAGPLRPQCEDIVAFAAAGGTSACRLNQPRHARRLL